MKGEEINYTHFFFGIDYLQRKKKKKAIGLINCFSKTQANSAIHVLKTGINIL